MKQTKMKTKDLILAGAFLALYCVISMIVIIALGFTPITFLMVPLVVPIVVGPIFSLYLAKVPKVGAISILGIIIALLANSTGYIPGIIFGISITLIAELIAWLGKYKSKKMFMISYMLFSLVYTTPYMMITFSRKVFMEQTLAISGQEFTDALATIVPSWIFYALVAGALVAGLIGSILGQKIMKKHFEKAGIC